MSDRFEGLVKIPNEPAARLLAVANAKLGVKLDAPAAAPVSEVLAELEAKNAVVDMLRLLSVALPPRERVWWACLAARDLVNSGQVESPAIVEATEAWVWEPTEAHLAQIQVLVEHADMDDDTALAGTAALYADGKMGPGEMSAYEAPPGGSEAHALVMNAAALTHDPDRCVEMGQILIERALDIARGGQGDVSLPVAGAEA
jgi:hypothetical protein